MKDTNNFSDFNINNDRPYSLGDSADNIYYFKKDISKNNLRESIIQPTSKVDGINMKDIKIYSGFNWLILILSVVLFLIALGQIFYSKNQKMIFRSFIDLGEFQNYVNQISILRNPYYIGLLVISLINFSIFIGFNVFDSKFYFMEKGFPIIIYSFAIISIWIAFKYILILLAGKVYEDKYMGSWYLSYETISLSSMGLILFPLLWIIFVNYSSIYILLSVLIISAMYLLKVINMGILLIRNSNFYLFQIILYLCTLEILPIVILVKAVNQGFSLGG